MGSDRQEGGVRQTDEWGQADKCMGGRSQLVRWVGSGGEIGGWAELARQQVRWVGSGRQVGGARDGWGHADRWAVQGEQQHKLSQVK